MSIEPSNTFERLLTEVEDRPIDVVHECKLIYQRAERTHNQKLYETMAVSAALVVKLRTSLEDRADFLEHEFFKDLRGKPSDDDLPRLVLRYILGAAKSKGTLYEQARSYAQVVQHFLDQGAQPHEIFQQLSKASVHAIRLIIPKRQRQGNEVDETLIRAVPKVHRDQDETADEPGDDNGAFDDQEDDLDDQEHDSGGDDGELDPISLKRMVETERRVETPLPVRRLAATPAKDNRERVDKPARRKLFNLNRDVSFDAGPYFDYILDVNEGDEVTVTLECRISEGEWVELRAVAAERQPPARHHRQFV